MADCQVTVILNSGANSEERASLAKSVIHAFQEAGKEVSIVTIQPGKDLVEQCKIHVAHAKQSSGVIVGAGGDGTINTVASLCYREGVILGIIPLGTFNYFARELGIPTTIPEAVHVIATGLSKPVSIGLVQDHIFLNNASFGLYRNIIRQREQASSRFGRIRIIAFLSAVYTLLQDQKAFSIKIHSDIQQTWHTTPMVFVGNNTLQLENLGMDVAECTKQDKLAIVIMKRVTRWHMLRFLFRGLIRNLKDASNLEEFCADSFIVETHHKALELVVDGEIVRCTTPLEFRVEKHALRVLVPLEVI